MKSSAVSAAKPSAQATSVVILAAGLGKRMKSARPKVLATLCGRPMVAWVIDQALSLDPKRILLVVGHGADEVEKALVASGQRARVTLVKQEPQLGTGHALQVCSKALGKSPGRVVVLYGDMPLLRPGSVSEHTRALGPASCVATSTASRCRPRSLSRPTIAMGSSGCVGTSLAHRSRWSVCRSPPMAK